MRKILLLIVCLINTVYATNILTEQNSEEQQLSAFYCIKKTFHSTDEIAYLENCTENLHKEMTKAIEVSEIGKVKGSMFDSRSCITILPSKKAKISMTRGSQEISFIQDAYKDCPDILPYVRQSSMLDAVAKLMNCKTDDIVHTRNDIVYKKWQLYKLNYLTEGVIQTCDTWNGKSYTNPFFIHAITILTKGVKYHFWKSDKIHPSQENYRDAIRNYRKKNKPNLSGKAELGCTLLIGLYGEFSLENENGSLDDIFVIVNDFAHPDLPLKPTLIKPILKPKS